MHYSIKWKYVHALLSQSPCLSACLLTISVYLSTNHCLSLHLSLSLSRWSLHTLLHLLFLFLISSISISQQQQQQQIVRRSFIHSYTLHGMCNDDEFALYEGAPSLGGEKTTIIRQRILSRLIYFIIIWETQSVSEAASSRPTAPAPEYVENRWRQVRCDEWTLTIVVVDVPPSGP